MKKIILTMVALATLSACSESPAPSPAPTPTEVIKGDECPTRDGTACK